MFVSLRQQWLSLNTYTCGCAKTQPLVVLEPSSDFMGTTGYSKALQKNPSVFEGHGKVIEISCSFICLYID